MCLLPAEAVSQLCTVLLECFFQFLPLSLLVRVCVDTHILAVLSFLRLHRCLEQGGAEEEVSLTQEVPKALGLWVGLGIPLTVFNLTQMGIQ